MTIHVDIPDARLVKLVKCLALLASDKPGERLAAADAALRLLKQHDLSWEQIILRKAAPAIVGETVEERIGVILANIEALSDWESGFIHDVSGQQVFSPKQRAIIERIYRKTAAYYGAKRGPAR